MTMKKVCVMLRCLNLNIKSKRTLFNESYLGMDRYNSRKTKESQSQAVRKKFDALLENPELKILTHDFKKFVYIINTEEDFIHFNDVFDRYAKAENDSSGNIKFQIFNIGPEIIRMYYSMNKPIEAFNLLQNPCTSSFICNLPSLVILQDLLYENGLYQEVCDVFNIVKEKQFNRKTFHFAPYVLCQAACYKMGTSESYKNVMALYERFTKHNSRPEWPLLMYTLMFALKNCSLDIPLKYTFASDPASVNIKLSALIKSGNYSDALSFCDTLEDKSVIMKSVAEDLCKLLENDGTTQKESLVQKLQKFKQQMGKMNLIDKTLDELAANVMHSVKSQRVREPSRL